MIPVPDLDVQLDEAQQQVQPATSQSPSTKWLQQPDERNDGPPMLRDLLARDLQHLESPTATGTASSSSGTIPAGPRLPQQSTGDPAGAGLGRGPVGTLVPFKVSSFRPVRSVRKKAPPQRSTTPGASRRTVEEVSTPRPRLDDPDTFAMDTPTASADERGRT